MIECTLVVPRPGPFEAQLHLYVDDHGLRDIPLTLRGEAQAAGSEGS